ncbi:MAG: Wzz/FepE/Etk N-terminal domain-containing protein [Actinobacteria bacterium]|nr:Wzz/FepE/Etk N-terminal domain-containing protein [Actinomycetota bacterium]
MTSNVKDENTVSLRYILKTFRRKKWLFIGLFLVVALTGLLFTFLKTPLYRSSSIIRLEESFYDDNLYKYFPVDAKSLNVYPPEMDSENLENENLIESSRYLESDEILNAVLDKLNLGITRDDLNKAIDIFLDRDNNSLEIVVYYSDPDTSYQIDYELVGMFIENKKEDNLEIVKALDLKIKSRIEEIKEEINSLDSNGRNPLEFEANFNSLNAILIDLEEIKYNLEQNKDLLIDRVEILQQPGLPGDPFNTEYVKNILIIIFTAFVVGMIAVFMPGVFKKSK